ncbi:MAG: carboxypeptidase-like regulatory domain-containing protein [Proteobacteria bacterium]|nr:carboxypeptidase-like regulatory domain-containing protein [Pseudomonadota bacterium]
MRASFAVSLLGLCLLACSDDPVNKDDFSIYACKDPVTAGLPNGNHNAGMDCQGPCHDHGYTVSGTVYKDASGTEPAVGATVTIRDGDLKIINMITASNGNFYTKEKFTFPFRTWVSSCPDVELMPDFVDTNTNLGASCNQGICHNNAAGTGVITLFQ